MGFHINETIASNALIAAGSLLLLAAYTGPLSAQPRLETGADAEVTSEGLHRVAVDVMERAWVTPDLDLTAYDEILCYGTGVSFREVDDEAFRAGKSTQIDEFPIPDATKVRVRQLFRENVGEELDRIRGYALSPVPGRNIVMVQANLVDVVSHVPPQPAATVDVTLSSAWEATIVLEVRDSMSDRLLARTADRQRVESEFDSDAALGEIRQLVRRWARLVGRRFTELSSLNAN